MIGSTGKVLQYFPLSAVVFSATQHAFFMNCLPLFFYAGISQQSLDEEICDPLHSFLELRIGDLEVVICLFVGRIGVVHSGVERHEFRVLIVPRKFARAHKEHML